MQLSLKTDRALIIQRILVSGSWEAVSWLRSQVADQDLKEWLVSRHGRGLSPRQLRFWGLILDLPARQVNAWVRTASNSPWGKR